MLPKCLLYFARIIARVSKLCVIVVTNFLGSEYNILEKCKYREAKLISTRAMLRTNPCAAKNGEDGLVLRCLIVPFRSSEIHHIGELYECPEIASSSHFRCG
jgi:hypothetical protein